MLGDHQTIVFLWHCLAVTPSVSRLNWGWGWYICPTLGGHPCIRECQLLMQWGGVSCDVGCMWLSMLVFHFMYRVNLSWSDVLPHEACPAILSLIFPFPWKAWLPWLGWDCHLVSKLQTPIFMVIVPLFCLLSLCHRLDLVLLKSCPQMVS